MADDPAQLTDPDALSPVSPRPVSRIAALAVQGGNCGYAR